MMQGDSPGRAPREPCEPGREAAVPSDLKAHQERPEGARDERVDETGALRRDTGLGCQVGDRAELGDIKRDMEREDDGDGRGRRMDGATSGARCESKRLGM